MNTQKDAASKAAKPSRETGSKPTNVVTFPFGYRLTQNEVTKLLNHVLAAG